MPIHITLEEDELKGKKEKQNGVEKSHGENRKRLALFFSILITFASRPTQYEHQTG